MKKICFIIPALNSGGSERVFIHLLNNISRKKYEINLILVCCKGNMYQLLKNDINVTELNCKRVRFSLLKIIKEIKILQPDIVISTISEFNSIFGILIVPFFKNTNIKFIARESHVLSMTYTSKLKNFIKSFSLKRFDKIILQSNDMYYDVIEHFRIDSVKCVKINNPIDIINIEKKVENINFKLEYDYNSKILLTVARLYYQKGIDLLIPIMEQLKEKNIKLYVVGDGPQRKELERQVQDKHLENKIYFLGLKRNPYIYMKHADLFLLSSRFEGFPNVLLEAGACGLYAICNNSPGGIMEIIHENLNGNIVNYRDINIVAKLIEQELNQKHDKDKIRKNIYMKYSMAAIIEKYEGLFDTLQ